MAIQKKESSEINVKIQLYYDYYEKHYEPENEDWYSELKEYVELLQKIKLEVQKVDWGKEEIKEKQSKLETIFSSASSGEINDIPEFVDRYLFIQNNGIGDIRQGSVWDTDDNPHKTEILERTDAETIINILLESDCKKSSDMIADMLKADRDYKGVRFRFLRSLFPNDFVAVDAPGKFDRLLYSIYKKLGIEITGDYVDKHKKFSSLYNSTDFAKKQMFGWDFYYMLEDKLNLKKSIVYYGAPGTGKTYKAKETAIRFIDKHRIINEKDETEYSIETIQFHPSFSYEDFIEGIRPTKDANLKLHNGCFKKFCKENGKKEILLYHDPDFVSKFKPVKYDFGQIKINELTANQKEILDIQDKNFAEGVTIQDVIEPAFFIIDEINRAELSRVFGELMYSLEYRGYDGKIKTQYSHLCENETEESTFFWENNTNWFFVPQNIYIVGTMNNIDRSVDTFDFALRRRFMWEEIEPNMNLVRSLIKADWANQLAQSLEKLNNEIDNFELLRKDYKIGHAYALSLIPIQDRFENANEVRTFLWDEFLKPLLQEYLRGLGDEVKSKEKLDFFKTTFNL